MCAGLHNGCFSASCRFLCHFPVLCADLFGGQGSNSFADYTNRLSEGQGYDSLTARVQDCIFRRLGDTTISSIIEFREYKYKWMADL